MKPPVVLALWEVREDQIHFTYLSGPDIDRLAMTGQEILDALRYVVVGGDWVVREARRPREDEVFDLRRSALGTPGGLSRGSALAPE